MESLTLRPPGERETVDASRAKEIVVHWKSSTSEKIVGVSLGDKAYTADAAAIIGRFIKEDERFSDLTVANLADCIAGRMEDEGLKVLQALCDAVGKGRELVDVDLSENAMGLKGIAACGSVLEDQLQTIQRLSMCNNGLSWESMDKVADILCRGAGPSPLTKIHFYNNMSGDKGCSAFKKILSECQVLEDVRFSGTRAQRPGSLEVAKELATLGAAGFLKNLRRLDLADNTFGEDGGVALATALASCPNLEYLNLRDCVLSDAGVSSVCDALDCPLYHLDLSGNDITAAGSKKVAKLLRSQETLVAFYCEENEMTSRGIKLIAGALSPYLTEVRLGCNECGSIGAKALVAAVDRLAALSVIHLDGNMFPCSDVASLESAFGDKLPEMEDNDEDEDADAELSDIGKEEDDVDEDSDGDSDENVNNLVRKFGRATV